MVIQNKPLLLDVEQHMKQQCELLPISCDIVASLISSNITEVIVTDALSRPIETQNMLPNFCFISSPELKAHKVNL